MEFNEYNGFICQQFKERTEEYDHPYDKEIAKHHQDDLMRRIKYAKDELDKATQRAQIPLTCGVVLLALAVPGFVYAYMKYGSKKNSMFTKPKNNLASHCNNPKVNP